MFYVLRTIPPMRWTAYSRLDNQIDTAPPTPYNLFKPHEPWCPQCGIPAWRLSWGSLATACSGAWARPAGLAPPDWARLGPLPPSSRTCLCAAAAAPAPSPAHLRGTSWRQGTKRTAPGALQYEYSLWSLHDKKKQVHPHEETDKTISLSSYRTAGNWNQWFKT